MSVLVTFLLFAGLVGLFVNLRRTPERTVARALRELRRLPASSLVSAPNGRVKLTGKARGAATEPSLVGQVACIVLHRVLTSRSGNRISWQTYERAFPFELDDGTGTIQVDPEGAVLDCEPLVKNDQLDEKAIRDGDTIVLVGDLGGAGAARTFTPALVSWRNDETLMPRSSIPWGALAWAIVTTAAVGLAIDIALVGDALDPEVLLGSGALAIVLVVFTTLGIRAAD